MLEITYNIMNNVNILRVASFIGVPLSIILIILFCLKSHRDERGWKIIGKASVIAFICFMILFNVMAKVTGRMVVHDYEFGSIFVYSIIQHIYNAVLLVEIGSIFILRKLNSLKSS